MPVDLDPAVRRALRHKAVDLETSVSHLVNVACARMLGLPEPPKRKSGPRPGAKKAVAGKGSKKGAR